MRLMMFEKGKGAALGLVEGKSVVEAYHRLGYAAVAVGNHEYDFGPAGERAVPIEPRDDPRGALRNDSCQGAGFSSSICCTHRAGSIR